MQKLKIFTYFNLFIYVIKFVCISSQNLISKNNDIMKAEHYFYNKRELTNTICNIKNCISCNKRNECVECKEGFELYKRRCYSKNCEIYGFCKFCDEYDCLKCIKGYKLNYGICDQKEHSRKKIILITGLSILFIFLVVYLYCQYKKRARIKIETGQVLKFMHPKPGFYQLNFNSNGDSNQEISQNKSLSSSTSESSGEKEAPIVNCCVVCGNKKKYAIADCGCSVCFEHFKIIKSEKEKIKCRKHNIFLSSSLYFKMMIKSNIKGNAVEKLGLPKCPICKINDGTQSFNCGCTMRVCEKCFNDNVYVFKYNQCPGCGMPYNPLKNNKKKKKNSKDDNLN